MKLYCFFNIMIYGYDDYEIDNYYDGDEETLNVNLSEDQENCSDI